MKRKKCFHVRQVYPPESGDGHVARCADCGADRKYPIGRSLLPGDWEPVFEVREEEP